MAINENIAHCPQKYNILQKKKNQKTIVGFAGKHIEKTVHQEQNFDSQEIRQLQNSLLKSRALNNNKISFEGYSKNIYKSEHRSYSGYGTSGMEVTTSIDDNTVSRELGNEYDVTGKSVSGRRYLNIGESGTVDAKANVYIADTGEHITEEIRQKYDFVAERSVRGAVIEGDLEKVKSLLNSGVKVDTKNQKGETPLHLAAEKNNLEMVKVLLEKGSDVNTEVYFSNTPLQHATKNNNFEMVKVLVEKGANLNFKTRMDKMPLHHAAENNNLEIAKYLIEKGADVNPKNSWRKMPLHFAAENNNLDMVKFLVEKGADINVNISEGSPLHSAAKNNNLDMVKLLVEKGADVNLERNEGYRDKASRQKTSLHYAAANNNLEMLKFLIEKGENVNAQIDGALMPLHIAAERNDLDTVKFLTQNGADVNIISEWNGNNYHGLPPVSIATKNNNLEMVKLLVEKGADVNISHEPIHTHYPLAYAAQNNNLEIVKFLVAYGADINKSRAWNYAKEGSPIKDYLKNYSIDAIPKPESYTEKFYRKLNNQGNGIWGDIKRDWNENKFKEEAESAANSEASAYQEELLEVNNKLLKLQQEANENIRKLAQKKISEEVNDTSNRVKKALKDFEDLNNINGFGKMAGYTDTKNNLIDKFCSLVAFEREGHSSATEKMPAGILCYGPMGTGKTKFATALAGQTECNYVRIKHQKTAEDTYELIEKEAVESQKRFKEEGKRTILHLDEIEVIARHSDLANKLKQFMDTSSEEYHCTLYTTTNHPDQIDAALLRGERFMKVALPPANKEDAAAIIEHYAKAVTTTGEIKYDEIAEHIVKHQPERAFSNDLIKETITSLGLKAAKLNKTVTHNDLLNAFKSEYPDISKTALELFEKNKQLLRYGI